MSRIDEMILALEAESPQLARNFPSLEELYVGWWSGNNPLPTIPSDQIDYFPEHKLRYLSIVDGSAIASSGPYSFRIDAGDYFHGGEGSVVLKRRARWETQYFAWYNSQWPQNEQANFTPIRMYLPGEPNSTAFITAFNLAIQNLLSENLWFSAKVRLSPGSFHDAAIVWTALSSMEVVSRIFSEVPTSGITIPSFSLPYRNAGLTPHPNTGESFGMLISQAILSSVWTGGGGLRRKIDKDEPLLEQMEIIRKVIERGGNA